MISLLVNSGRLFPMSLVLTILCTFLRPCDVDQGTNVAGCCKSEQSSSFPSVTQFLILIIRYAVTFDNRFIALPNP